MVNKKAKDVYIIPNQGGLLAYKYENNKAVEEYKFIDSDKSYSWR